MSKKGVAEPRIITPIKLRLPEVRMHRVEEMAAYKGLTVDQYVSEVVDAHLADERGKLREESTYVSSALTAAESIFL